MNYRQTLEYIDELSLRGSVLGLDNMVRILDKLDNPQQNLKFIHVAGTNGKGSVCRYISAMLIKAGYKTGVYTSPSVFEYLEKIRVGNRNISQKSYAECMSRIKECAIENSIEITSFEAETAAAFLYFYEVGCDIVVLETGMGGISDATNVVDTTVMSIITSISMDHYGVLGRSVLEIAQKKAGIIKAGAVVVSAPGVDDAINVINSKASELGCRIIISNGDEASGYKLMMQGEYQRINASVAICAARALKELGYNISDEIIRYVLENITLDGRFEIISKKPLFIIDGAHNVAAAKYLRETLINKYSDKKKLFIIGVFADKDYEGIIQNTVDLAEHVITVATKDSSRALPAYELAKAVSAYNKNVSNADSIEEALEIAKLLKPEMIVAFGSLSYLGYLKKLVRNKK